MWLTEAVVCQNGEIARGGGVGPGIHGAGRGEDVGAGPKGGGEKEDAGLHCEGWRRERGKKAVAGGFWMGDVRVRMLGSCWIRCC